MKLPQKKSLRKVRNGIDYVCRFSPEKKAVKIMHEHANPLSTENRWIIHSLSKEKRRREVEISRIAFYHVQEILDFFSPILYFIWSIKWENYTRKKTNDCGVGEIIQNVEWFCCSPNPTAKERNCSPSIFLRYEPVYVYCLSIHKSFTSMSQPTPPK